MRPLIFLLWALTGCTNLWVDSERITDFDGDGFSSSEDGASGMVDCDDFDQNRHPLANEICDGIDNDCDGLVDDEDNSLFLSSSDPIFYKDQDGDGFGDAADPLQACALPAEYAENDLDCDDLDRDLGPPDTWYPDADRDLFGDASAPGEESCIQPYDFFVPNNGDCNDQNASIHPGVMEGNCLSENPEDLVDKNCDGQVGLVDNDLDGFVACDDCNDNDDTVNPNAVELCDGMDNNCDGTPDNEAEDALTWYADMDNDGLVDADHISLLCSTYPRWLHVDALSCEDCLDCDDYNPNIGGPQSWFPDEDGDGFGDLDAEPALSCESVAQHTANNGDCDDTDSSINPSVIEGCGTDTDLNCDGTVEEVDGDGDGFLACDECDDTNPLIHPDAAELCDSIDNNCNGVIDDGGIDAVEWFADYDGDGYGDPDDAREACTAPLSHVGNGEDCDDSDPSVNPTAAELCDGLDNDCNYIVPKEEMDYDLDGYVKCTIDTGGWDGPVTTGHSTMSSGDCDGQDISIHPEASEICDGKDNDCDSLVDDDDDDVQGTVFYEDSDHDGYGNPNAAMSTCHPSPSGYVENDEDCDDGDARIYPGTTEEVDEAWYDGRDSNCDGLDDYFIEAKDADYTVTGDPGDSFGAVAVFGGLLTSDNTESVLAGNPYMDPYGIIDAGAAGIFTSWATESLGFRMADTFLTGTFDTMEFGRSVASIGDLNGDGQNDMAIGARSSTPVTGDPGAVFIFLGPQTDADAAEYDHLVEGTAQDQAGWSIAGVGDSNGDLFDDLLIGAPGFGNDGGAGLFLGPISSPIVSLADADTLFTLTTAFVSSGPSDAGQVVATLSDLDGDGIDDFAIGAPRASVGSFATVGQVFVYFGGGILTGASNLQDADLVIGGTTTGDKVGTAIRSAGDADGDGLSDLLINAEMTLVGSSKGRSYLLVGLRPFAVINLNNSQASFEGENSNDLAGNPLSGAGDINGDGNNDLMFGSYSNDAYRGAVYVVHGPVSGSVLLSDADIKISGDGATTLGASLDGGGDINADGFSDILMGGPGSGTQQEGSLLLFLGGN